jgi:integral membrane protein (TIGR01906 family)
LRFIIIAGRWLFMFSLPVLLLSASICFVGNSLWLYKAGFNKHDVSQTTGLDEIALETAAISLINYFNSDEEYIEVTVTKDGVPFELFTEEETIHFKDVKGLIRLDYYLLLGTALYALVYIVVSLLWQKPLYWRLLAWGVVGGSGITLVLMLVLTLAVLLNFDRLFLQFHLFSFANEFWSAEGYMLLLFPQGFWFDATILCGIITAVLALVLAGVSISYLLRTRRRPAHLMYRPSRRDDDESVFERSIEDYERSIDDYDSQGNH